MPHTQSAKKRLRQNQKRQVLNRAVKSRLSTLRRRFNEALLVGDTAKAQEALTTAQKAFDQAGAKGTIHKNNAARKVSRMSRRLQAAKAAAVA
jgi:small subunit ribosomal protein S20